VYYRTLTERQRNLVDSLVRKSLVTRMGFDNPRVVANEFGKDTRNK